MDFSKLFSNPFILEHTSDISDIQWLMVRSAGFVLVAILIVKWVWPTFFAPSLKDHQEGILHAQASITSTLNETAAMRDEFRARLQGIEDETERRMEEAVQEAVRLKSHILSEGETLAAAIIRRGEDEVIRERDKAFVMLRKEFIEDVIGAAQYAAEKSLNVGRQRKLVEDFVGKIGSKS